MVDGRRIGADHWIPYTNPTTHTQDGSPYNTNIPFSAILASVLARISPLCLCIFLFPSCDQAQRSLEGSYPEF